MSTVTRSLTYEEWLKMPPVEDGRDEVVKGELRFMPPNHSPHAEIIEDLSTLIGSQLDRKQVRILCSDIGLIISRDPLTCRSPDIAVYWRNKMKLEDGYHTAPPDLIVEVISPAETRRRKEEKLEDYAAIGVPEVWLVSSEAESVEIRMLRNGRLERTAIEVDGTLQPTRFPGVSIPVSEIWPD